MRHILVPVYSGSMVLVATVAHATLYAVGMDVARVVKVLCVGHEQENVSTDSINCIPAE